MSSAKWRLFRLGLIELRPDGAEPSVSPSMTTKVTLDVFTDFLPLLYLEKSYTDQKIPFQMADKISHECRGNTIANTVLSNW